MMDNRLPAGQHKQARDHMIKTFLNDSAELTLAQIARLIAATAVPGFIAWGIGAFLYGTDARVNGALALAYAMGARHAFDADHVIIIDNAVRRMTLQGRYPFAAGLFFGAGHSLMVLTLAAIVVGLHMAGSDVVRLSSFGGTLGPALSALFLLAIGGWNLLSLWGSKPMPRHMHAPVQGLTSHAAHGSPLARLALRLAPKQLRSWHLAPIGLLFAFGFDAATEIVLLGLSVATFVQKTDYLLILLLPVMFAGGMMLLDLLDSIMMVGAYRGNESLTGQNRHRYRLAMTLASCLLALSLGFFQLWSLLPRDRTPLANQRDALVGLFATHSAIIGLSVAALFLLVWIFGAIAWKGRAAHGSASR